MKKGFTLIELMVVVIIVAILAATALPQYQKAIERARTAEVHTVLNYIEKMARMAFLEKSLESPENLDICDVWYRKMGLESIGNNHSWKSAHFLYRNENCMVNNVSVGVVRGDDAQTYPPTANDKYAISLSLTKNGMNITRTFACGGVNDTQKDECARLFPEAD